MNQKKWLFICLMGVLMTATGWCYTITVDGDPSDWLMTPPTAVNTGHVARNASMNGSYIWTDDPADARTDISPPAEMTEYRMTADADNIYFLVRFSDLTIESGDNAVQVQIAIDRQGEYQNGQQYMAHFCDTEVDDWAYWEYLVSTRFGSTNLIPVVFDVSFNPVYTGTSIISAANDVIEISIPWAAIGGPNERLIFTVGIFRSQTSDETKDISGVSDCLDAVTNYTTMPGVAGMNTWVEVSDGVINYRHAAWYEMAKKGVGDVKAPLLISEVYYDTIGTDADEEWIGVYNNTSVTLAVNNFKLSDEEAVTGTEGTYSFYDPPALPPGEVLYAAQKATGFFALYGCNPDAEMEDTDGTVDDMVKDTNWSSGSIALGNSGDEVLLLDPHYTVLDAATYEGNVYPGVNPHPGVSIDHTIMRDPLSMDTNDCSADFIDNASPDPCGMATPVPTDVPTQVPTEEPTQEPTDVPTPEATPTEGPSANFIAGDWSCTVTSDNVPVDTYWEYNRSIYCIPAEELMPVAYEISDICWYQCNETLPMDRIIDVYLFMSLDPCPDFCDVAPGDLRGLGLTQVIDDGILMLDGTPGWKCVDFNVTNFPYLPGANLWVVVCDFTGDWPDTVQWSGTNRVGASFYDHSSSMPSSECLNFGSLWSSFGAACADFWPATNFSGMWLEPTPVYTPTEVPTATPSPTETPFWNPVEIPCLDFDDGLPGPFISAGDWELGAPTAGPSAAATSPNCWGTVLDGDYTNNVTDDLTVVVQMPGTGSWGLAFSNWFNYEANYDSGQVRVDGTPILPAGGTAYSSNAHSTHEPDGGYSGAHNADPDWETALFDLSAYTGQIITITFNHATDISTSDYGWYIDDICIVEYIEPTEVPTATPEPTSTPTGECPYDPEIEPNNDCADAAMNMIACEESRCGVITADDDDYYMLMLDAPTWVTVSVFADDSTCEWPYGQGLDPYVEILAPDCTEQLAYNGDNYGDCDGWCNDPEQYDSMTDPVYLDPAEGPFYIHVWPFSTSTGPYVVSVCCYNEVKINEVLYDTSGTNDAGSFVELYGPPNLSLDGFSLVGINGSNLDCDEYHTTDLTGMTIPADGFFVIAQDDSVANYDMIDGTLPQYGWQNGPDNIVLRYTGIGTIELDAVGYGFFDVDECFAGEGDPAPDVSADISLSRYPDGDDTDDNLTDFCESAPSSGTANDCLYTPTPLPTATFTATPVPGDTCDDPIIIACNECVVGTTDGATNFHDCGTGHGGPDLVYELTLLEDTFVQIIGEADYDADWTLAETCSDTAGEIVCADDYGDHVDPSCGDITHNTYGYMNYEGMLTAGTYYIWVDGYYSYSYGNYALEVVCVTGTPTEVPTVIPTEIPTEGPTEIPTAAPTVEPTQHWTAGDTSCTVTNNHVPIYTYYEHTRSVYCIAAEDMMPVDFDIESIGWYVCSSPGAITRAPVDVYVKETMDECPDFCTTEPGDLTAAGFTQVVDDGVFEIDDSIGWKYIDFNMAVPFTYTADNNLMVVVCDLTNDYISGGHYWSGTERPGASYSEYSFSAPPSDCLDFSSHWANYQCEDFWPATDFVGTWLEPTPVYTPTEIPTETPVPTPTPYWDPLETACWNFDDGDPGPFQFEGDWALGAPTAGPAAAASSPNCWGTVLDGNYSLSADDDLTVVILVPATGTYALTFSNWFDYESGWDSGQVQINGTAVEPLEGTAYNPNGHYSHEPPGGYSGTHDAAPDWETALFSLSAYAGQAITVTFNHRTDSSNADHGWFIDDICVEEFVEPTATPVPTHVPGDTCDNPLMISCDECVTGTTEGATNFHDCGTGHAGPDVVYELLLTEETFVAFIGEADYDADWTIATSCSETLGDILCVDTEGDHLDPSCGDIVHNSYGYMNYTDTLAAGSYYIWIDSYSLSSLGGNYALEVLCPEGTPTPLPSPTPTGTCPYPFELEPNDDCPEEENTIACGDSMCGEIDGLLDVDYYKLVIDEPMEVTVSVFADYSECEWPYGTGLDSYVSVYDAECALIDYNDDNYGDCEGWCGDPEYWDSMLTLTLDPEDGPFYIAVEAGPWASEGGPYVVRVCCHPGVYINEIYYDADGTDIHTYTELIGPPGASLDGLSLIGLNGSVDCDIYDTIALDGNVIPADGLFVVAQDDGVPNYDMIDTAVNWQNGPDSVQLVMGESVLDAVGYGDFTDLCFAGEGDPVPEPADDVNSLSRYPDGDDTDDNLTDFCESMQTPGESNMCIGTLDCTDAVIAYCGVQIDGDTTGGTSTADQYGCGSGWAETGPEDVYVINLDGTESLLYADLSNMTENLDVFILGSCNNYDCLSGGDRFAYIEEPEAGAYYVVVDGRNASEGAYTLRILCQPALDCSEAVMLTCGSDYSGDTTTADNDVNWYPDCTLFTESGPEVVHTLVTTEALSELAFEMTPETGVDLDMFLLDGCSEFSCVDYSASVGSESIVIEHAPAGAYFIVVDGYDGDAGTYDLTVTCTGYQIPAFSGAGITLLVLLFGGLIGFKARKRG